MLKNNTLLQRNAKIFSERASDEHICDQIKDVNYKVFSFFFPVKIKPPLKSADIYSLSIFKCCNVILYCAFKTYWLCFIIYIWLAYRWRCCWQMQNWSNQTLLMTSHHHDNQYGGAGSADIDHWAGFRGEWCEREVQDVSPTQKQQQFIICAVYYSRNWNGKRLIFV